MSRYGMSAEEKLLKKIFGEEPDRGECKGCYFKGRKPILELYPKDGEYYPSRDNPEECERGVLEIFDAIECYLSHTLAMDFKKREPAQDILMQMMARIEDYMDDHMGKITPEDMKRYQTEHMAHVFSKVAPEKYKAAYDKYMSRYEEGGKQDVVGLDAAVDFAAKRQAEQDIIDELRIALVNAGKRIDALCSDNGDLKRKAEVLKDRAEQTEKKYSAQVKDLTKEILALEHRLKEMEKEAQFGYEDDGK